MGNDERRLIIDTDTASDDALAILLAVLSDRVTVEGLTVVTGNVDFDRQVTNAKYTLELAGKATEIPVYEGARTPLVKSHEPATEVHGEDGLGGDTFPEPEGGIPSAAEHGVTAIVRAARENPGEITLVCIGPLTNLALALQYEPDLGELLDSVWVMGGAATCSGNVTPAAEFNFWVDPDAAKRVLESFDVTLVDWGATLRYAKMDRNELDSIESVIDDAQYVEFFLDISGKAREHHRDTYSVDGTTQPDSLTVASLIYPDIVTEANQYPITVDEREGLTRGYSMVDRNGATARSATTCLVESVNESRFKRLFFDMLVHGDPDRAF